MRVSERRPMALAISGASLSSTTPLPSPAAQDGLFAADQGELLCVRYPVEPRLLEEALDALAHAPFPINPQLRHPVPSEPAGERRTVIEFPAYAGQIESLMRTLRDYGLDARAFQASPMLESISA